MTAYYSLCSSTGLKRRILFSFVLILLTAGLQAQPGVSTYSYTPSTTIASYSAVSGTPTTLCSGTGAGTSNSYYQGGAANTPGAGIPIGFTFIYNCIAYTTIGVHTNGYIWFGTGQPSTTAGNPIGTTGNLGGAGTIDGTIAAYGSTLMIANAAGSYIKVSNNGTVAPNRVFEIEWSNYKWNSGLGNGSQSYYIKLYETTNKIEVVHKDMASSNIFANNQNGQVGLRGSSNADFKNCTVGTTGSKWIGLAAGGTAAAGCTIEGTAIGTYPSPNILFTWTPTASCCTQPTTGATLFTSSSLDPSNGTGTIGFTRGSGDGGVVVIAKDGSAPSGPSNGTAYTPANANTNYGSGTAVGGGFLVFVENGSGSGTRTVNLSNLTSGHSYYFSVYEYNSAATCYISSPLSGGFCIGPPATASVTSSVNPVCQGSSATLSLTGLSPGTFYTYQWQNSPTSGSGYGNSSGSSANSSYATPTTLPSNPTYYVCQVTCPNTSQSTQSNELSETVNALINCSCIPSYAVANGGTRGITQIILNGVPNINNTSAVNNTAPYYTLYTAASPVSNAGLSVSTGYALSVKVGSQAAASNNAGAWIDYNQDGVFSSTEFLGSFSGALTNSTTNINFTVPVTALSGITGMRVRHRYGAAVASTDACTNFTGTVGAGGAGETEDYRVNISSCAAPTVQASGNSMGAINTTDATINWSGNGNGDAVLVVLNQGSAPASPSQATAYTANSDFTLAPVVSGTTRAIYAGTGNSVNVSGLITNTTYFYSIYTYLTGTNCYNVSAPASGSFTTANSPMITTAQTVTHPSSATIIPGSINNQILQVKIDCSPGTAPALVVSQLVFSTTALVGGTTNPADIANAKVFFTGTSSTFSSATQYGSTVVSPNGSFTVNGSTTLASGSNYFWLTYDIIPAPTIGDFVDARLTSINVGSMISFISPAGDPAGNRQILLTYCIPSFQDCACSSCLQSTPFNTTAISFGTLNVSGLTCQSASWLLLPNTGSVTAGQSYPLSISRAQAGYTVSAIIYVDWNHNGILNDPGELILNQSYGSSTTINVPSVTVPGGALTGITRMRVISLFQPAVVDPCNPTSTFRIQGEARDFDITVISACTAPVMASCPSNIVVCSNTPATATWTNPTATGTTPTIVCSPASGSTFAMGTTAVTCTATNSCGTSSCSFNVTVSQSPAVSASASAPFCEGTAPLQLTSTAPTATSWLWTGPNGYTSTNQNPTITGTTYDMTGNYEVIVTDPNGCKDSVTIPVTIYQLPNITLSAQAPTPNVCIGDSLTLLAENIGPGGFDIGGATYLWSTNETSSFILVGSSGTYSVTGTNGNGCINTDNIVVTQSAPPAAPVIVPLGDVNLCSSDGGINWSSVIIHTVNYSTDLSWNTGNDFTQDIMANYPFAFQVEYKDALGCKSASNIITTIPNLASTDPLSSQITSDAPGNVTCAVQVQLTLAEELMDSLAPGYLGDNAQWKWYLDGGSCGAGSFAGSGASVSVTPPAVPGPHTYYVRAEGICNTTNCASIVITVKDPSVAPTSSQASPAVICEGDQTVLSVSGGQLGTGASWKLYEDICGGVVLQSSSSPNFTVTPQSPGLHTYYIRAEGDCNNTVCTMINVDVKDSSAQATSLSSSSSAICAGDAITMNISGGHLGTGAVWTWYEGGCGVGAAIQSGSSTSFTITPLSPGLHTYYVRAEGDCNTTLCRSVSVTVNEGPVIGACPSNITQCDNNVATWINPSSSGSPTASVVCSPASGSTFVIGTTTVICTASNVCGTSSCSFSVTINESPVIGACPSSITQCDNHIATWINPSSGGSPAATVVCVPASGSTFATGTTIVTCTASNVCGTSSCSFNVTINESPVIGSCPLDITQCDNHVATWINPTSIGSPAASVVCSPASGSTFATGTSTVTCTASNVCGTSSCSFSVTIHESPIISACPSNITQCDNHVATWINPTSGGSPASTVVCVPASGSTFTTGTTTVTCTASNVCGTSSCSFSVTINESPIIGACPANITQCDNHVATWINPSSSGSPTASVTCSPASGSTFATGTSTVTCTASNVCGTSSCSFSVTINESPVIGACPSNITQCDNHVATWINPTSGGSPAASVVCSPASGSTFTTGTTTVTCTASNVCGTSSCSFSVTINESPVIGACPSNITQCDNHVATWINPSSSGSPAASVVCVPASGSTFPTGTTTVNCTASNVCGTSSCSFSVTINDSPVIGSCPTDITQCDNHVATWINPTSGGSPAATVVCVPASGSTFVTGITTVTCTASNVCGTSSCSFNVTINTSSSAPSGASSNSSQVCLGNSITLNVSGGSLGTGANWIWYEGNCGTGGVIGTGASIIITPSTSGSHTYFVRAEGICNTTPCVSTTVTVQTTSTDPASATSNAPVNGICLGSNVTLTVSGGTLGNGAKYYWYEDGCGNGLPIDSGSTITVTPSFAGLHSYYVRAEGPCNVTNCAAVSVLVGTYSVEATSITSSVAGNSICTGNNITLTLNGGFLGTVAQWKWYSGSCGGTAAGTGASVIVNPAVTTTYYVRAEGSCNNTICRSIVVNVSSSAPSNPPPTITSAPNGICSGNGSTVICQSVTGATFYSWSAPNGTTFDGNNPSPYITTTNTVQVTFGNLPNGISGYDICVFAGNGCGNTVTKCRYIRGRVQSAQTITGNASSCPNTTSAYSIVALPGADSYTWTITGAATINGGGTTLTTTATTINVNFLSGWTSGTLTVYGSMGCGYSGPAKSITIISTPVVPGVMSGPTLVCPNGTYTFSIAPVAGASAYNWSTNVPGAIIGAGTTSRSITFPAVIPAGSTVSVTATGSCGTSAPRVKSIATGLSNAPGTISGPATGQCGQTGVSYSILPVAGATSYLWTANNGASINGLNNITTASVDFPALFSNSSVSVVAINGCGNSAPQTKVVTGAPASPGPITGTGAVCVGQAYTYSVVGATGATAYVWSSPAGSLILSGQNSASISVLYLDNTGGTVSVYASNACGASSSSTFAVSVTCRVAQISQGSLIDATLYPNPTIGTTTLKFETVAAGDYKVSVVDMTGQVMQTNNITAVAGLNLHELDLSTYAKGLYMVRLEREGEAMQMLRITVQ